MGRVLQALASGWVLALVSISARAPAQAEGTFPFKADRLAVDFANPQSVAAFERHIATAGARPLVYIDWKWFSPSRAGMFGAGAGEGEGAAAADTDEVICEKLTRRAGTGGMVEFGGRPNAANDKLLATFRLWFASDDPFTILRCEEFGGHRPVRLRGFFYVTDVGTAGGASLRVSLGAHGCDRIPAAFFTRSE